MFRVRLLLEDFSFDEKDDKEVLLRVGFVFV